MPEVITVFRLRNPPTEIFSAMAQSAWRKRFVAAWALFDEIKGDRTQAQDFAEALGWPLATFADISKASVPPRAHRIDDLSRVTGLHPGWLGHGVEPKYLRDAANSAEDAPGRPVDRVERGRDVPRETAVDKAARRKRRTS